MTWVEILNIESKVWNGKQKYLIHFKMEDLEQYVEFNAKIVDYWKKFFTDDNFKFEIGMKVNVFRVPGYNFYSIKGVQR